MIILGYILTILGKISYWTGRFFKKKSVMMATNSLSAVFSVGECLCFGSLHGAANSVLIAGRGLCVNYKDKRKMPMHWLFALFLASFITVAVIFWDGWASIFALISMFIHMYANWYLPPQKLRLATVFGCCFNEGFLFCIGNWVGMALELTIIVSNLASWFKYHREREETGYEKDQHCRN